MERNQLLYSALEIKKENLKQSCRVLTCTYSRPKMMGLPVNLPLESYFDKEDFQAEKINNQLIHKIRITRQVLDPLVNDWQEEYLEFQSKQEFELFFDASFLDELLALPTESRFDQIKEKLQQKNKYASATNLIYEWLQKNNYHLKKQEYAVSFIYDRDTIVSFDLQDIAKYTEKDTYFSDLLFLGQVSDDFDDWITMSEFDASSEHLSENRDMVYLLQIDGRVKYAGELNSSADELWAELTGNDNCLMQDLYTVYDEQENEVLSLVDREQLLSYICFQFLKSQHKFSELQSPLLAEIPMSEFTDAFLVYLTECNDKIVCENNAENDTSLTDVQDDKIEYLFYNGYYIATNELIDWDDVNRLKEQSAFKMLPSDMCLKMLFEWLIEQGYHLEWTYDFEHSWAKVYNYDPLQIRQSYSASNDSMTRQEVLAKPYYTIDGSQGNRILSHVPKESVLEVFLSKARLF